jgi:DNA-binding CsgD family transcriptional regulator
LSGPALLIETILVDDLYARGQFTECLAASEGDVSKTLLRARTQMRLRHFREALDELDRAPEDPGDAEATALALRLQCGAALMDWPEVARVTTLARSLRNVSDAGRAEIAIARASAAFYQGDAVEMRSALLAMNGHVAPRFIAWELCLLSLAASLERQYIEQARVLERMVRFIEETPAAMEVALLANAAQTLADLSREVFSANTFEFAVRLAERIAWTPDLAEQKFLAQRSLAWAYALRGLHRKAQRMMHALVDAAPSPQWRATLYAELAYLVRIAGSGEAADALLEHASEYALAISWESSNEERVGLLSLIELTAERDVPASLALLDRYEAIGTRISGGLSLAHDHRLEAMEWHARAVALLASGRKREAMALLERSFTTFKGSGYSWRAASSALRLHGLTGERKWLKCAQDTIADFPDCAFAAEVRRRESGSSDPRVASLTLTQRRAFQLVCEGMSDAEIAGAMEITINTARNHVAAVRQSFGVHTRSQVVAIARSSRLVV